MSESTDPNFARLLAPFIEKVPEATRPAFLAALERGAAQRYREWAEAAPEHAGGLLACAEREEEIASCVDKLFPADAAGETCIRELTPGARSAYYEVFEGRSLEEQWRIQASAERQGANAWRLLASEQSDAAVREALFGCATLEEESAAHLEGLLA